jgi:hypothetical protein
MHTALTRTGRLLVRKELGPPATVYDGSKGYSATFQRKLSLQDCQPVADSVMGMHPSEEVRLNGAGAADKWKGAKSIGKGKIEMKGERQPNGKGEKNMEMKGETESEARGEGKTKTTVKMKGEGPDESQNELITTGDLSWEIESRSKAATDAAEAASREICEQLTLHFLRATIKSPHKAKLLKVPGPEDGEKTADNVEYERVEDIGRFFGVPLKSGRHTMFNASAPPAPKHAITCR